MKAHRVLLSVTALWMANCLFAQESAPSAADAAEALRNTLRRK